MPQYLKFHELPSDFGLKFFDERKSYKIPKNLGHIGIDTENHKDGKLVLIASENDYLLDRSGIKTYDALKFISQNQRKTVWFFNIKYDYDSILKFALENSDDDGKEAFKEGRYILTPDNKIIDIPKKWNNYRKKYIEIIPENCIKINYNAGKGLKLSLKSNQRTKQTYCYDIANFFNLGGLDATANELLGFGKAQLSNENLLISDVEKIPDNVLIARCQKDAELTGKLGQLLDNTVKEIGIKLGYDGNFQFKSNASLSKILALNTIDKADLYPFENKHKEVNAFKKLNNEYIETITKLQEYAIHSYKGGLFILFKKGRMKKLDKIDISSAYPNIIRTLPSLENTYTKYTNGLHKDAMFGFYLCNAQFDGYTAFRTNTNELIYPNTYRKYPTYLTKDEVLFLKNRGYQVDIIDGYEIFQMQDKQKKYPFKQLIGVLIALKQQYKEEYKKTGNTIAYAFYLLTKLIMNSFYGSLSEKNYGLGILSNYVYSTTITARTRIQLITTAERCFNEIVEFDTDSITGYLKPEYKDFFKNNHNLGQFETEKMPDDVILIQTGVSFIVKNSNPEMYKKRGFGFNVSKGNQKIRGKIEIKDTKIVIDTQRPLHSKEAIVQARINEINEWQNVRKIIDLNDTKRSWVNDKITWNLLLTDCVSSEPYSDAYLIGHGFNVKRIKPIDKMTMNIDLRPVETVLENFGEVLELVRSKLN